MQNFRSLTCNTVTWQNEFTAREKFENNDIQCSGSLVSKNVENWKDWDAILVNIGKIIELQHGRKLGEIVCNTVDIRINGIKYCGILGERCTRLWKIGKFGMQHCERSERLI